MSLVENYIVLNNSFKKRLVYRLGIDAGFFSEYNNMILGMLYCLDQKISFAICSSHANFKIQNGWTDYFQPFCLEDSNINHVRFNWRIPNIRCSTNKNVFFRNFLNAFVNFPKNKLTPLRENVIRHLYFRDSPRFHYFTHNIWYQFRDYGFAKKHFIIPELGIDGDIQHACAKLIELTWKFNPQTQSTIRSLTSSLQIPESYVGFHIRRGDKIKESDYIPINDYINRASELTNIRNAFILTDEFEIIDSLLKYHPTWNIYTFCVEGETGYDHRTFEKKHLEIKNQKQLKLFASMELLSQADLFIGTFSSNPGMYLGMRMSNQKAYGVDTDKWFIA